MQSPVWKNIRLEIRRNPNNLKPYIILSKDLGWRNAADATHPVWRYSTNSFENRRTSNADVSDEEKPLLSIAIAGNSYVHGDESRDEDTGLAAARSVSR